MGKIKRRLATVQNTDVFFKVRGLTQEQFVKFLAWFAIGIL